MKKDRTLQIAVLVLGTLFSSYHCMGQQADPTDPPRKAESATAQVVEPDEPPVPENLQSFYSCEIPYVCVDGGQITYQDSLYSTSTVSCQDCYAIIACEQQECYDGGDLHCCTEGTTNSICVNEGLEGSCTTTLQAQSVEPDPMERIKTFGPLFLFQVTGVPVDRAQDDFTVIGGTAAGTLDAAKQIKESNGVTGAVDYTTPKMIPVPYKYQCFILVKSEKDGVRYDLEFEGSLETSAEKAHKSAVATANEQRRELKKLGHPDPQVIETSQVWFKRTNHPRNDRLAMFAYQGSLKDGDGNTVVVRRHGISQRRAECRAKQVLDPSACKSGDCCGN